MDERIQKMTNKTKEIVRKENRAMEILKGGVDPVKAYEMGLEDGAKAGIKGTLMVIQAEIRGES